MLVVSFFFFFSNTLTFYNIPFGVLSGFIFHIFNWPIGDDPTFFTTEYMPRAVVRVVTIFNCLEILLKVPLNTINLLAYDWMNEKLLDRPQMTCCLNVSCIMEEKLLKKRYKKHLIWIRLHTTIPSDKIKKHIFNILLSFISM